MKILKIAAKYLPLFNGICEIDFLPQQRVNSENAENMSELFSTPSNTFIKIMLFHLPESMLPVKLLC